MKLSDPSLMYSTVLLPLVTSLSILLAYYGIRRNRHSLSYPPGPKRLPVIGNLLDVPKTAPWITYTKWAKTYGDILSLQVPGQVIIVCSSLTTARDLLDRRSNIYSDRPVVPFFDLMNWIWNLTTSRFGDRWRIGRKMLDRGLRPSAIVGYRTLLEERVHLLLKALLSHPEGFREHINHMQGALTMSVVYGYDVTGVDDRYLDVARRVTAIGNQSLLPGALLVNTIPSLKYLPEWFPGTDFKALARLGDDLGQELIHRPFQFVKDAIAKGTVRPSIVLENLQQLNGPDCSEAEEAIRDACGSLYLAGSDTTTSILSSFFLMLVLHPEVQTKAQTELDSVVGRGRLPNFDDREHLPYVNALCMELFRWRPVTPLAVPHATTEDDVYNGYLIPKGALVFPNVCFLYARAILHDPKAYPDPDAFKPERFLTTAAAVQDDSSLSAAFGFGRRICPGRHLVDSTLFIAASCILSSFHVTKAKNAQGQWISVEDLYTSGIVSYPLPFQCSITPRCVEAAEVVSRIS